MKKLLLPLAIATTTLVSNSALAKSSITIDDEFKVDPNSHIEIEVPVGEIELITTDSDLVTVKIRVKENDNSWFSSVDLDDIKLEKRVENGRVYLTIDEDKTNQFWQITVPRTADLEVELGVGEAKLDDISRNLELKVGVGEANVDLVDADNYAFIQVESGVGEADIDGVKNVHHDRHMVGGQTEWIGEGKYQVEVEVGVGEAEVDVH